MTIRSLKQDEVTVWLDQAITQHRANNLRRAGELYAEILIAEPHNVNAWHLLGLVELNNQNYQRAEECISQAIKLSPKHTVFYINLGIVLQRQAKYDAAERIYCQAIQANADADPELHFNLGLVQAKLGKLSAAKQAYHRVLELAPQHVKAFNNFAGVCTELGEIEQAISYYNQALNLDPKAYRAANNLANIYFNYYGDYEKAKILYQKAVATNLDFWEAKFNLANCYRLTRQLPRAVVTFQACIKQGNNNVLGWHYLGNTYEMLQQTENAIEAYQAALQIDANFLPTYSKLYYAQRSLCNWQALPDLAENLDQVAKRELAANSAENIVEEPHEHLLRVDDMAQNRHLASIWSNSISQKMGSIIPPFNFAHLAGEEVIRIGYLAANFAEHEFAELIANLMQAHDRSKFIVYAYAYSGDPAKDSEALAVTKNADHYVNLAELDYFAAANKIYVDKINILIDLSGYHAEHKLEILALRPAPIQINYLGFLASTGAKFIDYTILDKIVLQQGELDNFSERLILMPACYQMIAEKAADKPSNKDKSYGLSLNYFSKKTLGITDEQFVFAAYCASKQIDLEILQTWTKILSSSVNSVMLFFIEQDKAQTNIKQFMDEHHVDNKRCIFVPKASREQLVHSLKIVDLVLEATTINTPQATSAALRAGVPVITLYGNHVASRTSASILTAAGLIECVAYSLEEYEYKAIECANISEKLVQLRRELATNRNNAVLFAKEQFCCDLELAYKYIWEAYLEGNSIKLVDIAELQYAAMAC